MGEGADLFAVHLAWILPLEADILAEALPVGEGAGAEVCLEATDEGFGLFFLLFLLIAV